MSMCLENRLLNKGSYNLILDLSFFGRKDYTKSPKWKFARNFQRIYDENVLLDKRFSIRHLSFQLSIFFAT